MNNSTIKTELETKLVEYVTPAIADFSKSVSMTGTQFAYKYEGQHNAQEARITHAYLITCKTGIDVAVQIDEFINYWLNDRIELDGENIYPVLTNFKQSFVDTKTFLNEITIQVYYYRQRQ
jgi:transcriptional regulatory protein LevR